jgi:hypothetical protein
MPSAERKLFWELYDQGITAWNNWRQANPTAWPDLRELSASRLDLRNIDFENANLLGAQFRQACLDGANLRTANLKDTNFTGASLQRADLREANLHNSNLRRSDLRGALLIDVNMNSVDLESARLDYAVMGGTSLGLTSLAGAEGWERIFHRPQQQSSIDLATIRETVPKLDSLRLRYLGLMLPRMGVPSRFLDFYLEQESVRPRWSSCFVSFSSDDSMFVSRLVDNMEREEIPNFLAPRHSVAGEGVLREIEANIALHDRLLVVCSKSSMASNWVKAEIEFALKKEHDTGGERMILPVDLDGYIFEHGDGFPMKELIEQVVIDFADWNSDSRFDASMDSLLSSLRLIGG